MEAAHGSTSFGNRYVLLDKRVLKPCVSKDLGTVSFSKNAAGIPKTPGLKEEYAWQAES